MDVFISWSGTRSGAAAEALRAWLPKVINAIKPWLSLADMDKGARWSSDIAGRLETSKAGIICLTPAALHSDWLLFEAGALSKTIENTLVCPLLIDLEPAEVKGPLAQFQATRMVKDDVLKLLKTLNSALRENALPEGHIDEVFKVWWPMLEAQFKTLPAEDSHVKTHRTDRDVLEEILGFVRNQNRAAVAALADEDKKQLLVSRAWKAIRSVHGGIGGSHGPAVMKGNDLVWVLQARLKNGPARTYTFIVPSDATPEEMETLALANIRETDQKATIATQSEISATQTTS